MDALMVTNNQNTMPQVQMSAGHDALVTRQAQEVQAAMVVAKKFPRDYIAAVNRITTSCQRKTLAERAMYEYPRGGQKVKGPSIRLAECLAQNWGNIDFGYTIMSSTATESEVMAYAWDLETNTRQSKVFIVKHIRSTRNGDYPLTDPRDIYEMIANQASRRVRSCILGIIPGDVVDCAVQECEKTLINGNDKPLIDRIRGGVKMFQEKFSVSKEMLEKRIGCKAEAFSEQDMITLNNIYNSLKDGMSKREDWFEVGLPEEEKPEVHDPLADIDEKPKKAKKADEGK